MSDVLRAPHEVVFSYDRSLGGADHVFLSGLARAELWGSRNADGRVFVPPTDWDPETGRPSEGFVPMEQVGVVASWSWIAEPQPDHPLDHPFALALIQLRGAATSLLHVVEVEHEEVMRTGMEVRADWRPERTGSILDIRAFVPHRALEPPRAGADDAVAVPEPIPGLTVLSEMKLDYSYEPGVALTGFLRGLAERRIGGGRCPRCDGVFVPPHSNCPACGAGPMTPVELSDRGTITSYTIVHIPFHGMTGDLPFVTVWLRLDGASVPFAHLLGECAPVAVRVGQRVEAVWAADDELGPTWESIKYFRVSEQASPEDPTVTE